MKGRLAATQRYKVEERPKAISQLEPKKTRTGKKLALVVMSKHWLTKMMYLTALDLKAVD
jgi:hypothetical protein